MKTGLILLIIMSTGLFSCGQKNKSQNKITADIEKLDSIKITENKKPQADNLKRFIDTEYKYIDTIIGKSLIIQNSLPKGGLEYTAPNGKRYVYAIFWTRIINEADNPIELAIDVHATSFLRIDSPNNYFKIFVPNKRINFDKLSLLNFGIGDLGAILDDKLQKASSLQRTISPKNASSFYIITLFSHGLDSPVRAGLSIKEGNLLYTVNGQEIQFGQINYKKMGQ